MNSFQLGQPMSSHRRPVLVHRTFDSIIELDIVPGGDQPLVVRSRRRACIAATKARARRGPTRAKAVVSWPMATVARIALPPARPEQAD